MILWFLWAFLFFYFLITKSVSGVPSQIQNDDEVLVPKVLKVAMEKEVEEVSLSQVTPVKDDVDSDSQCLSPLAQPPFCHESSSERMQLPVTIHSIIAETTNDVSSVAIFLKPRFVYLSSYRNGFLVLN